MVNRLNTPILTATFVNIAYRKYARPLKITRLQLFFLDYLIREGHTGVFRTCQVIPEGTTQNNISVMLSFFVQNRVAEKLKAGTWRLLPLAFEIHKKVLKDVDKRLESSFRWR
jgi:hypothetical protein